MIQVLLATHNGEKFLRPLLESLLAQTFQDFQVLISDDGSTDSTLQVIDDFSGRYPEKFVLRGSRVHGGAKHNFMFLVSCASAEYVMFCDQDDVWLPNKIADALAAIKKSESEHGESCPILIHTDLIVVDDHLRPVNKSFMKYQNLNGYRTELAPLLMQNVVTGCTVMMNRSLLEKARINNATGLMVMHDWWFSLIASAFGRIQYLDSPSILYRQHINNVVGAKKWGWSYITGKIRSSRSKEVIRVGLAATSEQASAFLNVYRDDLLPGQCKTVAGLANITRSSWISRRLLIIKYRLFKVGFLRNVGLFLYC